MRTESAAGMRPQAGEKPRIRLRKRHWQLAGGRRRRRMRLNPASRSGQLLMATVYVFTGRYGARLTCLKKAFATAVKKAGITYRGVPVRIAPHVLRKAYATWVATENLPHLFSGHSRKTLTNNKKLVHPERFEPPASAFGGQRL